MNIVYYEIDEFLELNEFLDYLNVEIGFGGNIDCFEFRNVIFIVKNDDINF